MRKRNVFWVLKVGWGISRHFWILESGPCSQSHFMYRTRSERWFCSKSFFGPYPRPFPISKSAVNHRRWKSLFPYISSEIFSHTSFCMFFGTRNPNIALVFAQKFFYIFFHFSLLSTPSQGLEFKNVSRNFFGQKPMRSSDSSAQKT